MPRTVVPFALVFLLSLAANGQRLPQHFHYFDVEYISLDGFQRPNKIAITEENKVRTLRCYRSKRGRKKAKFKHLWYTCDFDSLGRPVTQTTYIHHSWRFSKLKAWLGLDELPLTTTTYAFFYHKEHLLDSVTVTTRGPFDDKGEFKMDAVKFEYDSLDQLIYQRVMRIIRMSTSGYSVKPFTYLRNEIEFRFRHDASGITREMDVIDTTMYPGYILRDSPNTETLDQPYDRLFFPWSYASTVSDSISTFNERGLRIERNEYRYFATFEEREGLDLSKMLRYYTRFTYNERDLLVLEEALDQQRKVLSTRSRSYTDGGLIESKFENETCTVFYVYERY